MRASLAPKPTVIHYGRWRNRFISAVVTLVLTLLLWFEGEDGFSRWIGMVLMGTITVFCLVPSETRIDSAHRVIERRWKMLGVVTVFRRHFLLAQFRQVCWQNTGSWQEGAGRTWKVGLEQISGRRVYVNYFDAPPDHKCGEAKQFAMELSKLTGLPLTDEIETG